MAIFRYSKKKLLTNIKYKIWNWNWITLKKYSIQGQKLFASCSHLLKFHFYKNKNEESFISLFLFFIPKMYFYFICLLTIWETGWRQTLTWKLHLFFWTSGVFQFFIKIHSFDPPASPQHGHKHSQVKPKLQQLPSHEFVQQECECASTCILYWRVSTGCSNTSGYTMREVPQSPWERGQKCSS